jgi:hypothetical protein
MRLWAAHAVFAIVLAGSLTSRERPAGTPIDGASLEPIVLSVAGSQGLDFRGYRAGSTGEKRTLVFDAHGCSQPVLVTWRQATFEDEAIMESAAGQGYQRQYVYIDQKWSRPDPWAVSIQRMKYSLRAMFGLTEYAPSAFTLQVEKPRDCQAAERIDWRQAWSRSYLTAAETTAPKHH